MLFSDDQDPGPRRHFADAPDYDEVDEPLIELVGAEMAQAWHWEWKEARLLTKALALKRQREVVAKMNFEAQHRGVDGLGQCVMRIDKDLFHIIGREKGYAWLEDPANREDLIRNHPELCLKPTYQYRPRIIVPGLPWKGEAA